MTPTSPRLPTSESPSTLLPSSPAKATEGDTHAQLLDRIRGEYLDMPGLKLTCPQAQRLWHLRGPECEALLGALIDAKFLERSADGRFVQVSVRGRTDRHRRVAKAQLEPRAY